MKNVKVVIGANYGDEGKGRIVDYLVSQVDPKDILNTLVVRFNGGAQAGHTVQTDKVRHVFSHFGSGTICGAPTYLSKFFIVNPMAFADEYLELVKKGIYPLIYIDENAEVTTPFDVLINQNYEIAKSAHVRGSVGMAVWETTERAKHISIQAKDLHFPNVLNQKVTKIMNDWFIERSREYHMTPKAQKQICAQGEAIKMAFLYYCDFMKNKIGIVGSNIMNEYDNVIFEGAQGLLLDISLDYTFGTASHTGLENVRDLIGVSMLDSFTVIYATRPYLTRHGGGMLPNERDIISQGMKCVDGTNGFNVWQREFRLGLLDINTLKQNIKRDEHFCASVLSKEWEVELFVSCADQIENKQYYNYYDDGVHLTNHFDTVMENVARSLLANKLYISHGPERNSVSSKNFF